jgi:plastocyanin
MTQAATCQTHRAFARFVIPLVLAAMLAFEVQAAVWAAPASQAMMSGMFAEIRQFAFTPSPLAIAPGTLVTWTNQDAIEHSITSGSPDAPSGVFDSGFFTQGQTFAFHFNEPGEYAYFCRRHTFMQGTLSVS